MKLGIQLPAEPHSASAARRWVRERLSEIGRVELVLAAEVGVSELVTNGILHAQTSIWLQLSEERGRVLIEVYDGSPIRPQSGLSASTPDPATSTVGRGLRIVRANAREWGVRTTSRGKGIWFEPTAAPVVEQITGLSDLEPSDRQAAGDDFETHQLTDIDELLDTLSVPPPEHGVGESGEEPVEVRLLNAPPWVAHYHRKRWLELIRELQLVALGEPSSHQELTRRFSLAAPLVDAQLYISEDSTRAYQHALGANLPGVDVTLLVPRSVRGAFVEVRELIHDLERAVDAASLLYINPGRQARELREWWLGEVIRQLDGEEPRPWTGDSRVSDEALRPSDLPQWTARRPERSGADA